MGKTLSWCGPGEALGWGRGAMPVRIRSIEIRELGGADIPGEGNGKN